MIESISARLVSVILFSVLELPVWRKTAVVNLQCDFSCNVIRDLAGTHRMSFKRLYRSLPAELAHMNAHISGTGGEAGAALPVYIESGCGVKGELLLALAGVRVPDNSCLKD